MYEELIQRLYAHCNTDRSDAITNEAADAIAALQAENAELRQEIERLNEMLSDSFQGQLLGELQRKDAALSRVGAERDAAKKCIYDVETYLELGSAPYIMKTIEAWKRGAQGEA